MLPNGLTLDRTYPANPLNITSNARQPTMMHKELIAYFPTDADSHMFLTLPKSKELGNKAGGTAYISCVVLNAESAIHKTGIRQTKESKNNIKNMKTYISFPLGCLISLQFNKPSAVSMFFFSFKLFHSP